MPQKALGEERWPPIAESLETQNGYVDREGEPIDLVQECASWYAKIFPQIVNEKHIDMSNVSVIAQAVVFFCLDIRLLYNKGGQGTPLVYTKNKDRLSPQWKRIEAIAQSTFPRFALQVMSYLKWVCAEKEDGEWDIGQRPPVGRFAPNFRKINAQSNSYKGERGRRDQKGGGKNRGRGNQKGRHPQKNRNEGSKSFEKQALRVVDDAINELKGNPDLQEIQLPPTNSFYRRIQHKHIVSLGFFSESSGEGNDRAVVLLRNEK